MSLLQWAHIRNYINTDVYSALYCRLRFISTDVLQEFKFPLTYFFAELLVDSSVLRQIYPDKFFQIYLWLHSKGLSNGLNNNVTASAGTNQKLYQH